MTDFQFQSPVDPLAADLGGETPAWALQVGEGLVRGLRGRALRPFPTLPSTKVAAPRPGQGVPASGLRVLAIGRSELRQAALAGRDALGLAVDVAAGTREAVLALRRGLADGRPFELVLVDAGASDGDAVVEAGALLRVARGIGLLVLWTPAEEREALQRRVETSGLGFGGVMALPLTSAALAEACGAATGRVPAAPGVAPGTASRPALAAAGRRVLLVDDSPIDAELTLHCLQEAGFAVAWAHDALEALAVLEASPFDAVLMDSRLTGMDGYEATRAIRGRFDADALPVIGLSADGLAWDRARARDAGMNEEIGKPVAPASLLGALARWIDP